MPDLFRKKRSVTYRDLNSKQSPRHFHTSAEQKVFGNLAMNCGKFIVNYGDWISRIQSTEETLQGLFAIRQVVYELFNLSYKDGQFIGPIPGTDEWLSESSPSKPTPVSFKFLPNDGYDNLGEEDPLSIDTHINVGAEIKCQQSLRTWITQSPPQESISEECKDPYVFLVRESKVKLCEDIKNIYNFVREIKSKLEVYGYKIIYD